MLRGLISFILLAVAAGAIAQPPIAPETPPAKPAPATQTPAKPAAPKPKPASQKPWIKMDYGPTISTTIESAYPARNITQ